MQKIIIDRDSLEVRQIINLDVDPRFDENWYIGYIIKDDVDNIVTNHGFKYSPSTGKFEENKDYKEPEVVIEESPSDARLTELERKLDLVTQQKDEEILELKLALVEIYELGGML